MDPPTIFIDCVNIDSIKITLPCRGYLRGN
jgi:hypothetical protein